MPERRTQHQTVEFDRVLAMRHPRQTRENDQQHGKGQQKAPHEYRERVVDQHAREDFLPHNGPGIGQVHPGSGIVQCAQSSDQRQQETGELLAPAKQTHDQHAQYCQAENQLRSKRAVRTGRCGPKGGLRVAQALRGDIV